jgi:hypothetical protein
VFTYTIPLKFDVNLGIIPLAMIFVNTWYVDEIITSVSLV